MVLTAGAVLFGLLLLLPPLRRNMFFILHCCAVMLFLYWVENHWFRATPFAAKTLLFCLVVQFVFINIFVFFAYWKDKRAARRGEWRIPEKDLHWLELLGGWSGALLAQKLLHHKNRKRTYQTAFWLVPLVQTAFIVVILQYLGLLHLF